MFWQELAKIGIFVQELYLGTDFLDHRNAFAGPGTKGQAVVKTQKGTVLWMITGRVYSPNPDRELESLLRVVFPPFRPENDATGFANGRFPVLTPMSEPLSFSCAPHQ